MTTDNRQQTTNSGPQKTLLLGKRNQLKVLRKKDHGVYLEGGEIGDILLPKRYVPQGTQIGDILDVFLYLDQEERLVATTEQPLIEVGQFAYLECTWTNEYGAYLNWGLMKDLFCPFREQKVRMQRGQRYQVYCYIGDFSTRLFEHLKLSSNGFSPYHDKSPADEIYSMFGVSKKVFKQAIGDLYKKDLIKIKPNGIELTIKGKATGIEE